MTITLMAEVGDPTFEHELTDALRSRFESVDPVPVRGHDGRPVGSLQTADMALDMLGAASRWSTIVAVGTSGWPAQVFALAGRVERLVLVDGLGGPWLDPRETMLDNRTRRRRLLDDPEAMAEPPGSGLDPRARHGIARQRSRSVALEAAKLLPVPTLAIDTGVRALSESDVAEVLAAGPHLEGRRLGERTAVGVADAVAEWLSE